MTGPVEAGTDVLAGGVEAGVVVAAGVVVVVLRSLQAPSESATSATATETVNVLLIVVSPSFGSTLLGPFYAVARSQALHATSFQSTKLAVKKPRCPQSTLRGRFVAVAQRFDLIMVASSSFKLAANHLLNLGR